MGCTCRYCYSCFLFDGAAPEEKIINVIFFLQFRFLFFILCVPIEEAMGWHIR